MRKELQEIKNKIDEIKDKYEEYYGYIGIRIQEEAFTKGSILDNSFVWIDGVWTDEELDGTCAVNLDDIEVADHYFGDHIAIVGGDVAEWGQDLGELIIRDAEVLEVIA